MFDLLVTGALVIDGSGSDPFPADIGVTGDTVTALGDLAAASARRRIDLAGPDADQCIAAPGFIDVHSHSDTYLLIEPSAPSKLFQGITTEVVGNCGASAAPITSTDQLPSDWADKDYPHAWQTVADYRRLLEEAKPAPNVYLLIGHNTLRRNVIGYDNRPASEDELSRMSGMLEQALDEGGRGFSTGLIYPPGMYAPGEELVRLCAVAARHGGIYTSHMRSESSRLLEAIAETISIGEQTGARVEVSHLKAAGKNNWQLLDEALQLIRDARAHGAPVAADRYPYTSSYTDLDSRLPDWAQEGGRAVVLGRVRDPEQRTRIRTELIETKSLDYWGTVVVGSTAHHDNTRFMGMPLVQVAEALGLIPVDAFLHLLDTDELKTGAFFFGMSDDNLRRVLAEPYVMLGSDASLRATSGPLSKDYPHPRAYGSFPRFIRMALDEGILALPEAVRKMTSLPADHFGMAGRGRIAEGAKADIVIFDPDRVRDVSDYGAPHQLSEGILHVIVNGALTLTDGRFTGERAGRMI